MSYQSGYWLVLPLVAQSIAGCGFDCEAKCNESQVKEELYAWALITGQQPPTCDSDAILAAETCEQCEEALRNDYGFESMNGLCEQRDPSIRACPPGPTLVPRTRRPLLDVPFGECPEITNPLRLIDLDDDGVGAECDDDRDGDGVPNGTDTCPDVANTDQSPEACGNGADTDGDGFEDDVDNCPTIPNPETDADGNQLDMDRDQLGDACDIDVDDDGTVNDVDNCPETSNGLQYDLDRDGLGDACDEHECYAIFGGNEDCLDPAAPFRVYLMPSGSQSYPIDEPTTVRFEGDVGEEITSVLLTNRLGELHAWEARLVSFPRGASSTLVNSRGSASTIASTPQLGACIRTGALGACEEYNYIRFTPDVEGIYVVEVTVELPSGDPLGGSNVATSNTCITVGNPRPAKDGGCAALAGRKLLPGATAWLALLGALSSTQRRRRRHHTGA